ncbi:unnamed protein product [Parnassius apollo]|uniref:(apollo) hypothetical protein n=1 Tax=Parnassius apollo TaxID=110799 RepID=A0A8S3XLT9_PARAO|nr:unnamed protein product [Parnassius apollo]
MKIQELQLKEREEVLRGWCELQAEVHALHESWRLMQDAAVLQRQQVTTASESIEVAADNVQEARRSLSVAERLSASAGALVGACAGAACGGPLGLLAGAKVGAAAALAGAALGYLGARALGRKPPALTAPPAPPAAHKHEKLL